MAAGARRALGADVGLALTGVAGPAEQDGVAVGTVCFGVALPDGTTTTTRRLGTQREQIRQFSVITALDLLRRRLLPLHPDSEQGSPPDLTALAPRNVARRANRLHDRLP
jgi:nicotinamide-nucleotide amidase